MKRQSHGVPYLLLALVLGCIWLLLAPTQVRATTENLRKPLAEVAADLKKFLDGRGETTLGVGEFVAPPRFASSAGPAIGKALAEELQKLKITIRKSANYFIQGRFLLPTGSTSAKIETGLFNSDGEKQLDYTKFVVGVETLAHLFGGIGEIAPNANDKERGKSLVDFLNRPNGYVPKAGTKVAAGPSSPYFLELLVQGKARTVNLQDGLPFIQIRQGEKYQIKLHNQSEYDAAVLVTVDGLSVFEFSDIKDSNGRPRYSRYVIPKKGSVTIPGWHRDLKNVYEFEVTDFPQAAAVKLARPGKLGSITATFCAAWTDKQYPQDEPSGKNVTDLGTGVGQELKSVSREVQRHIGNVRAAISVRYTR